MTTVTPSDRAGAASAKRSASIPTQRSGQALRLLVLGTGEGAAAFRERAAEAGAELAQRFSVRVTHVVAEDGIGEEDARVVRARTAGLPVLRLAEGARLLEDDDAGAGEMSAAAEVQVEVEVEVEVRGVDADGAAEAETLDAVDKVGDGVVATEGGADGGGVEVWADPDEASSHRVQVVRPRNEFVPESAEAGLIEVGPADVFTGSALEAVLLFPPLSVSAAAEVEDAEDETGVRGEGEGQGEGEFWSGFEVGADGGPSALMEVASGACGCGDEGSELDLDSCADTHVSLGVDADVDVDGERGLGLGGGAGVGFAEGEGESEGEGEGAVEVTEVGVVAAGVAGTGAASRTAASIAWALVPLVSLGLLTPVAMGYAAFRTRSRLLWGATAAYSAAMITAFTLSAASPLRTGSHAAVGELLTACLVLSWLGGTVHSFLIRRRVFG